MPDATVCQSLTQGIVAFNISDLVPNGFINEIDSDRKGRQIRMLPANRVTVELQYSVTAPTGTTLNDLAGGIGAGGLGGLLGTGAAFSLGQAIGASLQGDFEPTRSRFVFHVCDAKTYINKEIVLTQEQIDSGIIEMPQYLMGVMALTAQKLDLTDEDIAFLGRDGDPRRGTTPDSSGLVQTDVEVNDNLFIEIVRDERKLLFRSDNSDGTNTFVGGSMDDLTDKKIRFTSKNPDGGLSPDKVIPKFKPGDKLYATYNGVSNEVVRHAIFASSFFFLFPDRSVDRIGQDKVQAWNFKPFAFKTHPNEIDGDRPDVNSFLADAASEKKTLDDIFGQRLTEALWDNTQDFPTIRGFYIADIRGIFSVSNETLSVELMIAAEDILDQDWWDSFINEFLDSTAGHQDGMFALNDPSSLTQALQRGFLFDVSDHVNSCVYDNEKFGYQRDLALALAKVGSDNPSQGVGITNLDLDRNQVPGREKVDLSSAKFAPEKMSSTLGGAYFIRDCNKIFDQNQLFFQGTSQLQADMFIRTPIFFDKLSKDARIYMERFSPQIALAPDGGIWVTTNPVSGDGMSADVHPNKKTAALVFSDSSSGSLRYHLFQDGYFRTQFAALTENPNLTHQKEKADDATEQEIRAIGFDKILGNEPGYSRGLEITTEGGRANQGYIDVRNLYKIFVPTVQISNDQVTLNNLGNRKIREIKMRYTITGPISDTDSAIFFVFPNLDEIIDNVLLPSQSGILTSHSMSVPCPYYSDSQIIIKGDGLGSIAINSVDLIYIDDAVYDNNRVSTSDASTGFDSVGNWYVFYEDSSSQSDVGGTGDPAEGEAGNSIQTSSFTEISCLVSYDQGISWYDFKGVVRTIGDETVRNPYAVFDKKNDVVHLFFVVNDALFYKNFSLKMLTPDDMFVRYFRPAKFGVNTPILFGLEKFTESGRGVRLTPHSFVTGNIRSDYWTMEFEVSSQRLSQKLPSRLGRKPTDAVIASDKGLVTEFSQSAYAAYMDRKGVLRVLYADGSKLFVRVSYDGGLTWEMVEKDGVDFHKHSKTSPPAQIGSLGLLYNESNNSLSVVYQADGMLFVKRIENSLLSADTKDAASAITDGARTDNAVFVVGSLNDEVKKEIGAADSKVIFPYPPKEAGSFDEDMAIQDVSSRAYSGGSGFSRFFYKDANGNLRAFTFQSLQPVLDTRLTANA